MNYLKNNRGKNSDICGKTANNTHTVTIANRNGSTGLVSLAIGIPLMLEPMYKHRPTGGVKCPRDSAGNSTKPKWRRFMPKP